MAVFLKGGDGLMAEYKDFIQETGYGKVDGLCG
jgi:hypothetical protein